MRYAVIRRASSVDLLVAVNDAMNEGYTPQGGVSFNSDSLEYIQAMVRPEEETPPKTEPARKGKATGKIIKAKKPKAKRTR